MNLRLLFSYSFSHIIFFKLFSGELTTEKNAINCPMLESCLQVSEALSYYEALLKEYNFDQTRCSRFEKIGRYVLEKHNLTDSNCYKQIQKPICRLSYRERDVGKQTSEEKKEDKENEKSATQQNSCEKTKELFLTLIRKCVEEKNDPLLHCASFDSENKTVRDPELFCKSSYFRKQVESNLLTKSVYGDDYKNISIKTISFKNEEIPDCINIVNNFNNCVIIGQHVFKNTLESCLSSNNSNDQQHYCNMKIEKVVDNDYVYNCSDVLLPYLASFKREEKTYKELCCDIKNYVTTLKEEKSSYLKEKRKLEEAVRNMKIMFKLSKIIDTYFNDLKTQMDISYINVASLFDTIKSLKNKKLLEQNECKSQLHKLYEHIHNLNNTISNYKYPEFDSKSSEKNLASFQETKTTIDKINKIEKDISSIAKILKDFIQKKKNDNFSDENGDHLNIEELLKLKNKYENAKNILSDLATRNKNTNIDYHKSQEQDFLAEIKNLEQLIEVNTDQIGLLIKKNVI